MKFVRRRSKCSECSLRDRNRVFGQGSFNSRIAVLGEAPGADEDASGTPFIGDAGQILRKGLSGADTNPSTVYYFNLICCRPPNNNLSSPEGENALENCRPGLEDEIEFLEKNGVRVIIAAGNNPAHALGISGRISDIRGGVYELESL